tara:strand:- start:368 stop:1045 length:678 start_codon:yes stop_codon:yes gene_type:complete
MKKRILLFEPDEVIRRTLLEKITLKKNFEVIDTDKLENVELQLRKSSFELLIMGTNQGLYNLTSLRQFIERAKITNLIIFMIQAESIDGSVPIENTEKQHFIEKPFRIENFYKTIFTTLAKISNSKDINHKIGPFTFFPLKKFIILDDNKKIELTEKEVDILKCLISSGEKGADRDKLLRQVWNYSSDVTTHTLETHIYRLRQKLEIDSSIPRLIISQGGGFKIR